ncbi:hypothetical protein WA026_015679 [Henosepilachna vigintioctopunctata]|uniref:J domain-containing protein n=1 Tax=Henosepilachna vigintioctopunctata TaxID=420089 RepID=A0AAW1UYJ4_9CUCU
MTSVFRSLSTYCMNKQLYSLRTNYILPLHKSLLVSTVSISERISPYSKKIKCWKCGIERQNINELFCQKCNIIQYPEVKNNYFKILHCNESFDIDFKELRGRYRHMQNILHPDKFSNSVEEKHISEGFSSLVNKAYDILRSPLKRAEHLLCLKGEIIKEDIKIEDPDYLMQIMDLNEEVERASPEELIKLNRLNLENMNNIQQEISEGFKKNDLKKVKYSIIKLRYYNSLSLHINNLLRERGLVD